MSPQRRRRPPGGTPAAPRLALALACLCLAPLATRAQLDDCLVNPTADSCRDYTVPQAVLESDLSRLCAASALGGATYSGWPSACTLWNECREGRAAPASCQPLSLLQTACNEPSAYESEACMQYLLLCAPQSVVQQCLEQPPLRELRPPMQYYTAVQQLCNGTAMAGAAGDRVGMTSVGSVLVGGARSGSAADEAAAAQACRQCSAMSFDPDKVTVQATQGNCPDPLGTLATLCMLASPDSRNQSCGGLDELCSSEVGSGFWGLCGGDGAAATPAPAPAPAEKQQHEQAAPAPAPAEKQRRKQAAPAPSPAEQQQEPQSPQEQQFAPAPAPAAAQKKAGDMSTQAPDRAGAAAIDVPVVRSCYEAPQQEQCRSFQQPDAETRAGIAALCGAMPALVGCSLWQQCSSGSANGSYCQPFSVLGSICAATPTMSGCEHWGALCATPGSVVQQCITAAPIRNVLVTSQTMDAVVAGCSAGGGAAVPGCELCVAAGWSGAGCPDPLGIMGQLCQISPGLSQCSTFAAMCAEAGATFSSLCSGALRAAGLSPNGGSGSGGSGASSEAAAADPLTTMYLHASMTARILFKDWVPSSGGAYIASCLAVLALALATQALKAWGVHLEARWAAQRREAFGLASPRRSSLDTHEPRRSSAMSSMPMLRSSLNASGVARSSMSGVTAAHFPPPPAKRQFVTRPELSRNAARAACSGGAVFLEYMVLLVVVTFNVGLIVSVTLGYALGVLAFGHFAERAAAAAAAAAAAGVEGGGKAPVGALAGLQPAPVDHHDINVRIHHAYSMPNSGPGPQPLF